MSTIKSETPDVNLASLPPSWTLGTIDDLCQLMGGGTPSRENSEYFGGSIIWLTPTEIPKKKIIVIKNSKEKITELGLRNSSAKIIPKGSVLLTSRASIGYVAIAGCDVTTNQGFASFVCKNAVHNAYLAYWLFSIKNTLESQATGTTFKEISKAKLKDFVIPLPPFPEQYRIVTKIEELFTQLDAGVASLKKVQAQLKRYRQAVLNAAFEGRLTQEWREEHKGEIEPANILLEKIRIEYNRTKGINSDTDNRDNRPSLPKKWVWTTFSSLGNWSGGGTPSTLVNKYWDGNILWITSKDMKVLKIFNSELKITPEGVENSATKMIPSGSLLFVVRSGILQRTLPVALNMVDATVNQDLKVLIPSKKINNEFLLWIAIAFGDNIRHNCAKDGTTVQSINIPALREFSIPLAPKEEQDEIVAQIEKNMSIADKVENTITTSLRQAETLRLSILKRAFEGKLVPQDPNDEPASILLERIKAEKTHHATEAKKGKTLQPKSPKRKIKHAN